MALIKCPECGKNISDHATACIHCGYPLRTKKTIPIEKQNEQTNLDNSGIRKCPSCGQISTTFGVYYCPKCNVRYEKYIPTQEKDTFDEELDKLSSKYKKRIILIILLIIIPIIIWKVVGPKTVESGNKYKHQIWNYKNKCDYSSYCNNQPVTHKIQGPYFTSYYFCDGCWEKYGQKTFNMLAEKNSKSRSSERETDAKICAKKAVEDQLKSPSTAKFCKYTEMTATNLGGNNWKITGYVDAQNSFGATLRENWTVTLTLTTSGFTDATVKFR